MSTDQPTSLKSFAAAKAVGGKDPVGRADCGLELAVAIKPALLRDALSRLLETVPEMTVVGYAENENQIRKVLSQRRPRVLLLDYEAMGLNREGTISQLRRAAPATRILVITKRSSEENTEQVLRAGASGLVGKEEEFTTLVRAIHAVAAGELWANRRTAAQTLEHLTEAFPPVAALEGLTKRELQIVDGVASGFRNKEIARRLNISQATVKSHLNAIFRRLKIDGRVALAMLAQERDQPKELGPFAMAPKP